LQALVITDFLCFKIGRKIGRILFCKQLRLSSLLSGRNVRWPRRMLPLVSHGEYAYGTDRRTDARLLHYAFCYGRGQHNIVKHEKA